MALAAVFGGSAALLVPQETQPRTLPQIADAPVSPASGTAAFREVMTTGVVHPTLMVQVGSQLSGDIVEVYVDFNDAVSADQPLARLDPESFEAAVREAAAAFAVARATEQLRQQAIEQAGARVSAAQAELLVAEARLERGRAERNGKVIDFKRTEPLANRGTLPKRDLDDAKTAVAVSAAVVKEAEAAVEARLAATQSAEAEVRMAEVELRMARAATSKQQAAHDRARADLERTIIRSPIDGVVVDRSVEVGHTVVASLDSPTLFTVAEDIRRMEVHANVDEADIGQIRTGQAATFTVDAYPERRFDGTVRQIRKGPTVIQNVVSYTIVIVTDNADLALLPGMTALVRIVTEDGAAGQQLSQR
jgi:HlyD family secretion protein